MLRPFATALRAAMADIRASGEFTAVFGDGTPQIRIKGSGNMTPDIPKAVGDITGLEPVEIEAGSRFTAISGAADRSGERHLFYFAARLADDATLDNVQATLSRRETTSIEMGTRFRVIQSSVDKIVFAFGDTIGMTDTICSPDMSPGCGRASIPMMPMAR